MTNTQKILLLFGKISNTRAYSSTYKIKNQKIYAASWEESPHNGDISDYKETPIEDNQLERLVRVLEEEYCKQEINKELEAKKKQLINTVYGT